MTTYLILFINILFLVLANLFIKKGALVLGSGEISFSISAIIKLTIRVFTNPYLLGGLFSYGIGFLLWIFILSRFHLNVIYPVVASAAIMLIAVISSFLFKESLSLYQVGGIVAVIFGIFLILQK